MNRCPYCGNVLKEGQKFCRGHNIAYKRRLLYLWTTSQDPHAYEELRKYHWLNEDGTQSTSRRTSRETWAPVNYSFRKFGIELETVGESAETYSQAIDFIRESGTDIFNSSYNHDTREYWKVLTDGSLCGAYPRELVSPPFTSEEQAIKSIRDICEGASVTNMQVDVHCGFHIHFDISDLTPQEVARVVKFYSAYEDEIDKLHSYSRRGSRNTYCVSIDASRMNGREIRTMQDLANIYSSRYYKVNLQAYLRHGTLEFRQHGGTLNFTKIWFWMMFCNRVLAWAKTENRLDTRIPLYDALNLSHRERIYWNQRKQQLAREVA